MTLSRRLALAALALLAAKSVAAQGKKPGSARSLFRSYAVQGRNPDGTPYSGAARLTEAPGGQVTVTWTIDGQSYSGTGPRDGHVLLVDWGDPHPVVYVIMPDGELHGTWADGTALDKLTPV